MRLFDAKTRRFMPTWSSDAFFLCDGLDSILGILNGRAISLSAPLTYEACLNLSDAELQRYYEEYGIVKFYPELSHERKAWLLWKQAMEWRWLGTPQTIEDLCQYLMDQTEVELHITDSLAFDVNGNLVHPELLNVFDAELSVLAADLPENTLRRVSANIVRFKNDRTQLRGFSFLFDLEGGDLDSTIAYTDGGNYETFFEMGDFSNAPVPYRSTGYFSWNQAQVQINAGDSRDVNPPLTYYNEGFSYRPTRYYSGVGDQTGGSTDGLLLINHNGKLALYNGKGSAIRIQRLDYEFDPCILIYPNSDKSPSTIGVDGSDISIYTSDGVKWNLGGRVYRTHRVYSSAADHIGVETNTVFMQAVSSTSVARNLSQINSITWQRAEVIRVWNPIQYEFTTEQEGDDLTYTFTLSVEDPNQTVHAYGYCRGRDAQSVYHYYCIEADYTCTNKKFSITVPSAGTQTASQSLIITKI